ncbi:MAG: hypothetical protein PVH61_04500 [Candidatus Aminicenantes bacterium]|jgi:hypothetical protein
MLHTDIDIFNGKRIIRYDPSAYEYGQILESLLNKDKKHNFYFHPETGAMDLDIKKIKIIGLSYPVLLSDKRWETIHLTASSLFIGSAMANARFDVVVKKQNLPVTTIDQQLLNCDLIGFTLFEDLFIQIKNLLSQLRNQYKYNGIIAAGGPLITLTPYQSTFHLPEINLLVRGEAEFMLPELIKTINDNDIHQLLKFKGFLFQVPGLIIISDFNEINKPDCFQGFQFNLDFLEKNHLEAGLEINISRGCKRGCIFCSAVQGRQLRKLPKILVKDLLIQFSDKLDTFNIQSPHARTININDDDILQDPDYAHHIFQLIKKNQFRLWGVQTSMDSFFDASGKIQLNVLDVIDDKPLYVEDNPLVWLGTDTFLQQRGKRLGKKTPGEAQLLRLIEELEKREIRNYHYWISSDYLSDWDEFIREFMFIYQLHTRFNYFGLIAHSPFLVPYYTTPAYRYLSHYKELKNRVKYRRILKSHNGLFTFPLVERVETGYRHLNRLLSNEKLNGGPGFFDYLRQKDYVNAFITLYNFLKQERMEAASPEQSDTLIQIEKNVEELISKLI